MGRSDNTSAGSYEVWVLERQEGQQRAECQKTCGRGSKLTEIILMSCLTPKMGL